VTVRRIAEGEQAPGGIIIPDTARERPQEGEVVAVVEGKYRMDGGCAKKSFYLGSSRPHRNNVKNSKATSSLR